MSKALSVATPRASEAGKETFRRVLVPIQYCGHSLPRTPPLALFPHALHWISDSHVGLDFPFPNCFDLRFLLRKTTSSQFFLCFHLGYNFNFNIFCNEFYLAHGGATIYKLKVMHLMSFACSFTFPLLTQQVLAEKSD